MIAAPLPPNPAAGPAGASPPGPAPTAETLASAFAGLLALLTGATQTQPLPSPNAPIGEARPPATPGTLPSLLPTEPAAGSPALVPNTQGQMLPAAGPHALPTPTPDPTNPANPTAAGGPVPSPSRAPSGPARSMPPNQGQTGAKVPDRQGGETRAPDQALAAIPVEPTSPATPAGERAFDPHLSLAGVRPTIEAVAGTGQAHTPTPPPPAQAGAPPPAAQIHLQISRAATDHVDHIRVRLEPPELGHVDIKLQLGDDNRFTGVVTVDRSETLDLLQRDSAALERGLRDAGLRADGGGLSFTLRRDQQESAGGRSGGADDPVALDGAPAEAGPERPRAEPGLDLLRLLDIRA